VKGTLLALLRGEPPARDDAPAAIAACLGRYECGGYLYRLWTARGPEGRLPPAWADALAAAHRRTVVDTLAALAELRRVGTILSEHGVPFLLLKGAAYLADLYDDPGGRMLTDVDLLLRPDDAGRAARALVAAGFRGEVGPHYPENRRFEMVLPGPARCRFECHWAIVPPARARVDHDGIWSRAIPCVVDGASRSRLGPEDALLHHVLHEADSYYGPSLKWTIDLRQMIRRWALDPDILAERAAAWGARTALHLACVQMEKIFPGTPWPVPPRRIAPGRTRRLLLRPFLSDDPLDLFAGTRVGRSLHPLRLLMFDRAWDAWRVGLGLLLRPLRRLRSRGGSAPRTPPWEWPERD
jgi:hypothetical protein